MDDRARSLLARRLALYLVADPDQTHRELVDDVERALGGGVTAVQLRAKRVTDRQALALGASILALCRAHGALFLVNDRLDLALALGAGGVHLGVDDLPVAIARRLGGEGFVIGFSPETDEQAAAAAADGSSYLGLGPVYGTISKPDAGEAIGLEGLRQRVAVLTIPTIGIGGIDPDNAGRVIEAGAVGVAVVGAILRADDPASAARRLAGAISGTLDRRVRRP